MPVYISPDGNREIHETQPDGYILEQIPVKNNPPTPAYDLLVRSERDRRISATDYLMALDYPLTDDEREPWRVYRQALRDITAQEGFPWEGGGPDDAACPWPVKPENRA